MGKNINLLIYLFCPALLITCSSGRKHISEEIPNVILILTDDQGSMDLNCYGATDIQTPNLDKLAKQGIKFNQFYAGSSISSPSRACILTGKTPQGAQLATNAGSMYGDIGMPGEQTVISEIFKNAGYATAHIGKWHLGYNEKTIPNSQGFDYSFGHMGGCIDNYSHFFYWGAPNRHDLWENGVEVFYDGKFFPELMVEKAETYIKAHRNTPFFLYFTLNIPHYPLQPPERWRKVYKNLPMPRRDYAAFISTMDEIIGKLITIIEKQSLSEQTIIFFLSDQGHSCEQRTFGGGGYAGPLRGCKFSLFEGGIRIPAIISWKGTLPADVTINQVCHAMDILPTLASLAGIPELPDDLEGKDLSGVIRNNEPSPHEALYWKLDDQWAVRKGNWKLIGNPIDPASPGSVNKEKDTLFLVNLDEDISERVNLVDKEPEKLKEMINEYLSWKYSESEDK